jgi:DNA-binding response OmpR family regulator
MRILVVEDDELTARALERGLAAEGYATEVAKDGVDGLHRAREYSYDAMILDVLLPGISGLAVCSELRASGCDLPVLMLTALGDPVGHTTGLDIGADDYIVKPFTFPVLLA